MEIKITIMVLLSAALHPLWNAMIKRDPKPEGAFVGNSAILVVLAGAHSLIAGHDLLAITKIWHLLAITVAAKLIYTASLVTMLRRVAILYGGRRFRCRHCHDLRDESQRSNALFNAISRVQRARK